MSCDLKACQILLQRATNGSASDDVMFGLLECFWNNFEVGHLRELLRSHDPMVVKAGAWILSELGVLGRPLLDECAALLSHENKFARFYALDSILANASPDDGQIVAQAILTLHDPEKAVQWKCLNLLRRAEINILVAAAAHSEIEWVSCGLRWIVAQSKKSDENCEIGICIASSNFLKRAFAAVTASRAGMTCSRELKALSENDHDAVADFASDVLEELSARSASDSLH